MKKDINILMVNPKMDFEGYVSKNNIDIFKLIKYVLQHYGGSTSNLLFLKLFNEISLFTFHDWKNIFSDMKYNRLLAEESFIDFFMTYTELLPSNKIFRLLGFSKLPKHSLKNIFVDKNQVIFELYNIPMEEIINIEAFNGKDWN